MTASTPPAKLQKRPRGRSQHRRCSRVGRRGARVAIGAIGRDFRVRHVAALLAMTAVAASNTVPVTFLRPAAPMPETIEVSELDGIDGVTFTGSELNGSAGISVAGIGDVNGDLIDDLLVGAPYADPGDRLAAGHAYVVYGRKAAGSGPFAEFTIDVAESIPSRGGWWSSSTASSSGSRRAHSRRRRLDGAHQIAEIIQGVKFKDGEKLTERAA